MREADAFVKSLRVTANALLLAIKQEAAHGTRSDRTAAEVTIPNGDCQHHIGLTRYDISVRGEASDSLKAKASALARAAGMNPQWLRPPRPKAGNYAIATDPKTGMAIRIWDGGIHEELRDRGFIARADIFFARNEKHHGL